MTSKEFSGLSGEVSLPMDLPAEPVFEGDELDPRVCASAPVARKKEAKMHALALVGKFITPPLRNRRDSASAPRHIISWIDFLTSAEVLLTKAIG
jgi:hypothetical protein